MNHVSALYGCLMLIHGGYTTENKQTLSDFNLFDMEDRKWVECVCGDEMGPRKMHTVQAIFDQDAYQRMYL